MITVAQAKRVSIDRVAHEMEILQRGKSMVTVAANAKIDEINASLAKINELLVGMGGEGVDRELIAACEARTKEIIAEAEASKGQFDNDIASLEALGDEVLSLSPADFGAKAEDDLIEESSIKGSLRQFIINLQKARTDALNDQLLAVGRVLTRARQIVEQYDFVIAKSE